MVKKLLKDGTISIDYVKLEINLADPLTKPLGMKLIFQTSKGMGLKPIEIISYGNPTFVIRDLMKKVRMD